jgi:hypothetical protein
MSQGGVEWGKLMQQTLPVKSMKAVGEREKMMSSMMGLGMEILEVTDDKMHFKMSKCPYGIEGTQRHRVSRRND